MHCLLQVRILLIQPIVSVDVVVRITGEQHPNHGFVRVSKTSDLMVNVFCFVEGARLTIVQDTQCFDQRSYSSCDVRL